MGKFYIFGGQWKIKCRNFNRSTESWTTGISLPNKLADGTAISVNGKIYLIGGRNASDQNHGKSSSLL